MPLGQAYLFAIVTWTCNKTLQLLIFGQSTPITSSGQQAYAVVIIAFKKIVEGVALIDFRKIVVCWGFLEFLQTIGKINRLLFISGLTLGGFSGRLKYHWNCSLLSRLKLQRFQKKVMRFLTVSILVILATFGGFCSGKVEAVYFIVVHYFTGTNVLKDAGPWPNSDFHHSS